MWSGIVFSQRQTCSQLKAGSKIMTVVWSLPVTNIGHGVKCFSQEEPESQLPFANELRLAVSSRTTDSQLGTQSYIQKRRKNTKQVLGIYPSLGDGGEWFTARFIESHTQKIYHQGPERVRSSVCDSSWLQVMVNSLVIIIHLSRKSQIMFLSDFC